MSNRKIERKVWLVPHPIGQFKEDVKMLALQNHLQIVDAKFASEYPAKMLATDAPKLTPVKAPAKKPAAKQE